MARKYLWVAALSLGLFNPCRANAQATTAPSTTGQLPTTPQARTVVLRGAVVTPNDFLPDSSVAVAGTKIVRVGGTIPIGANVVETDSFIFPGLIDLHNHITWNFLPRWKPNELFANRYEWQQRPAYKLALDAPHREIVKEPGLACDAERYGEVKAIVGGATSTLGTSLGAAVQGVLITSIYLPNGNPQPGPKFKYKLSPKDAIAWDCVSSSRTHGYIVEQWSGSDCRRLRSSRWNYLGCGTLRSDSAGFH